MQIRIFHYLVIFLISFCLNSALPAEVPKVLSPENAVGRAGEKATVEFRVEASTLLSDRESPICFLNSNRNFKSNDNFTVVIFSEGLKKFQKAQIDDPASHFRNKLIQVTGEIGLRQGRPQIIVEYVGQIEIVDEKKGE